MRLRKRNLLNLGGLILLTILGFENCGQFRTGFSPTSLFGSRRTASATSTIWPDLNPTTPTSQVQGSKIDENGNPFSSPGATISLKVSDDSSFGPSFDASANPFSATTPSSDSLSSTIDVGTSVPDGYTVQYSTCENCLSHPDQSFRSLPTAGPIQVNAPGNGFVDIQFKYIRSGPAASWYDNFDLTCMYDGGLVPPETDSVTFSGDHANVRIGASSKFSGLPVSVKLINPAAPDAGLDIIDAASGTGSSWQASFGMTDPSTGVNVALNQAVGDSWWQWGSGATFQGGLRQVDWSPMYSDHDNKNGTYESNSPCFHIGTRTFDGQTAITSQTMSTSHGQAIQITNSYTLRATQDQSWQQWAAEEAFYLNRKAAQTGQARVYLVGPNQSWFSPALNPYDYDFTANDAHCDYFVLNDMGWNAMRSDCHTTLSYMVLVYTVQGQEIAMAISRPDGHTSFGANLAMARLSGSCRDATSYDCGNIEWHSGLVSANDSGSNLKTFANGATETYQMIYTVGTLAQLNDLGFGVTAPVSSSTTSPVTTAPSGSTATSAVGTVSTTNSQGSSSPSGSLSTASATSSAGTSTPATSAAAPSGWIVAEYSGKCVELPSSDLGVTIQQFDCHTNPSTSNQQWKFVDKGNGYYEIHNAMTDGCLQVVGGSSASGAAIVHGFCGGDDSVLFMPVSGGANGTKQLLNKGSGQCVDVVKDGIDNWVKLQQLPCNGGQEDESFRLPL